MLIELLIPVVVVPLLFGSAVFLMVTRGIRNGSIRSVGRLKFARAIDESRKEGR